MPFSRTCEVLEERGFLEMAMVLDFCLQKFERYPKMDVA